jgi:hypothetical protein
MASVSVTVTGRLVIEKCASRSAPNRNKPSPDRRGEQIPRTGKIADYLFGSPM